VAVAAARQVPAAPAPRRAPRRHRSCLSCDQSIDQCRCDCDGCAVTNVGGAGSWRSFACDGEGTPIFPSRRRIARALDRLRVWMRCAIVRAKDCFI
jgi:hypothetical protein